MDEKRYQAADLNEMAALAQTLVQQMPGGLVLLQGGMGLGKTTLVKLMCAALGVDDPVTSPTFSLVNEYRGGKGEKIYHFDWYRIEDEEEALGIGYDEYLADGDWLFMEWPEKISNLLPLEYQLISLTADADGVRQISLRSVHE